MEICHRQNKVLHRGKAHRLPLHIGADRSQRFPLYKNRGPILGNWSLQSVSDPGTMKLQGFALCPDATSNRPKCEVNFHFRVQRFSTEAKEKNLRRSRDASSEVFSFGQNLSIPKMPLML